MTVKRDLKKTVLDSRHRNLGARMAPFGGYWMPIQYKSILAEHAATRNKASVFDTCHMGEFKISGASALESLEQILSCDLSTMSIGQCRYGLLCNPQGGVLDDLVVYRLAEDDFMLVVNAGTQDEDYEWISMHVLKNTVMRNESEAVAKMDLQGPHSPRILQALVDESIEDLKYYTFRENSYMGRRVLISRTGYTGEVGFEVYSDPDSIGMFWDRCIEMGAVASGLGARNTLRLEMGLPLYGHEWSRQRNAADAGLERFISKTKRFIGCDPIRSDEVRKERLVGIAFESKQAAREENPILFEDGKQIGIVTSGSFAPSLGYAIALGYIDFNYALPETKIAVNGRHRLVGKVVSLPFYTNGTARKNLSDFL